MELFWLIFGVLIATASVIVIINGIKIDLRAARRHQEEQKRIDEYLEYCERRNKLLIINHSFRELSASEKMELRCINGRIDALRKQGIYKW